MHGAVGVLGTEDRLLHADRPHVAAATEERPEATDRGKKVAAVLLHHRQEQIAAGMAAETRVLKRRQARQQHAARLTLVACEREGAAQDVTRREDAELIAQLARAA